MKISYKFLLLALSSFVFISDELFASNITRRADSNSSRSKSSSSRKKSSNSNSVNSTEYTKEECASKYILGLDKECYNVNNIKNGGVYSDCSDNTMADYYDVMDMQLSYIVGVDKFSDYKKNCDAYKSYALEKWLSSKAVVEESAIKGSSECIFANRKLTAAKKCYTAAISHDGNFFEFSDLMNATCGEFSDVARKFSEAGDLGVANLPKMLNNYSTLQFTNKDENWRSAVEAVLAGYVYDARQACGEETYELLELNQFTADKRENLLTSAKESFYNTAASNLGKRLSNNFMYGSPFIHNKKPALNSDTDIATAVSVGIGHGLNETYGHKNKKHHKHDFGNTTPQLDEVNFTSNVYVIEGVSSINKTRARLVNIIDTGDTGMPENQDDIDVAIIQGLGGRAGSIDSAIYGVIGNLTEGDTFVIKQKDNVCQILKMDEDSKFEVISSKNINKLLKDYTRGCLRIVD